MIMDSQRYELRHPIPWKGKEIIAVTLRWPPLHQFHRVIRLAASAEYTFQFIALMTGLPRAAVDLLDFEEGPFVSRLWNEKNLSRNQQ